MLLQNKLTNKAKIVAELFKVDFENTPDENFIREREFKNSANQEIIEFHTNLFPKELDLFTDLDVLVFKKSLDRNYNFSCPVFNPKDAGKLVGLIDFLIDLYGEDDNGLGKLNFEDLNEIAAGSWGGRIWTSKKHKTPVFISYDNEGEGLTCMVYYKAQKPNDQLPFVTL